MAFTAEVLSAARAAATRSWCPKDVAATFSSKRPPVLAHINGVEYRSRLMVYGGQCYLGLRKDLLRRLDVGAGDHVEIELVEDHRGTSRCRAARAHRRLWRTTRHARPAYERLPFTHRNEYARWIDEGKKPETRADRVAKTIKRLTESR